MEYETGCLTFWIKVGHSNVSGCATFSVVMEDISSYTALNCFVYEPIRSSIQFDQSAD